MSARRLLLLAALIAACDDEPPPPGTSIGTFAFSGQIAEGEDPVADPAPACEGEPEGKTLVRCPFEVEQALAFDALLSYDPEPQGVMTFYLQPEADATRQGTLDGVHFVTAAPPTVGCRSPGVPREIPGCVGCRITAAEWITGDFLERVPEEGCPAPAPVEPGEFDPDAFGGICGTLLVRVQLDDAAADAPCTCPVPGEDGVPEPVEMEPACAIVYTLTGNRT